ncbi:carbohydrate esterase family 16 protein [Trametes coccinea BRFM310]|uniref:Carbohydrate esterase family 16 protein n=1 Tax=Trametes coccinea (strain BRFM310) TaxID=1353009 RepID=A0A1Y2IM17_TRAC3|nr:carbohydrate esterase family 16 protein [Trametes coccinea BRFM310]
MIRPIWPGFEELKHIVIFGDSYSDIGYDRRAPHPHADNPLGVDFPGFTLCCRYDEAADTYIHEPNWVGHVIDLVKAEPSAFSPLIYDFAIGINDCVWNVRTNASVNDSIDQLWSLQQQLYDVGASIFCFVDVPPICDYPGHRASPKLRSAVLNWSKALREMGSRFSTEHEDATVLLWSSWAFFSRILTNPTTYGFLEDDAHEVEGGILVDGLHSTTRVHRLIAEELLALLRSGGSSAENLSVDV